MEVVKEVERRWEDLGHWLGLPLSKRVEIRRLYQSNHHRMEAMVDYYVRSPTASWRAVTRTLQSKNLYKQADETAKYVKGTDVNNARV